MDLSRVSRRYDNDELYDAYTGDFLYKGQFATYEGGQLDGSFIRRRTVSIAPELALPPRRVVTLFNEQWVLSDPIVDGFHGKPIRQTMSARKCHGLYQILTVEELLNPVQGARSAYAFCRWVSNTADAATTEYEPFYEFSLSATEESVSQRFLYDGEKLWHTRMSAEISEGFLFAEADLLTEFLPASQVTVASPGTIDPVTLVPSGGPSYTGILVERYMFYRKTDQAQESNYHGDKTLLVAESSSPAKTGTVEINGTKWAILATENIAGGYALHVRRNG